jgi:hypothetical protein
MSSWVEHVKDYSKEHGISYKEALKEASNTYQQVEGGQMKWEKVRAMIGKKRHMDVSKIKNPSDNLISYGKRNKEKIEEVDEEVDEEIDEEVDEEKIVFGEEYSLGSLDRLTAKNTAKSLIIQKFYEENPDKRDKKISVNLIKSRGRGMVYLEKLINENFDIQIFLNAYINLLISSYNKKKNKKDLNLIKEFSKMVNHDYTNQLEGGELDGKTLKKVLNSTYDEENKDIGEFKVDNNLSGKRVKVLTNPNTNQTIVAHRGSQGYTDWLKTNAGMALGYKSNRFSHAEKIQKKAEKKYGAKNISTIGHSLGAAISSTVGKNSKETINLNKPTLLQDYGRKVNKNEYNIRSSGDIVSGLHNLEKDKKLSTIKARTYNGLIEHKPSVLNRQPLSYYGTK